MDPLKWILFGLVAAVAYVMLVGVSFRFLGRKDRLGIIRWFGYGQVCPKCGEWRVDGTADWHQAGPVSRLSDEKRWFNAALWPFVWLSVLVVYLFYYCVIVPVVALARIAASTAKLSAGE